jgi:hypothetical protein
MIEALLNPVKELHGVQVHALTLMDLSRLITEYRNEMATLLSNENGNVLESLIINSPKFIASVISLAIHEPQIERLQSLPIGIQLDFIMTAWELSRITPEQLGKVIQVVTQGIQRIEAQITTPLPDSVKT